SRDGGCGEGRSAHPEPGCGTLSGSEWRRVRLLRRCRRRSLSLRLLDVNQCQSQYCGFAILLRQRTKQVKLLFRYCGSEATLDIAFPDWSFWGWTELNIKPWEALRREITEGNATVNWTDRAPYGYWKGNPTVGAGRRDLLRTGGRRCRKGSGNRTCPSNARTGTRSMSKARGWSVSEKYILACDSVALMVRPRLHDFFSRGLTPLRHYWPIRDRGKCPSIKFAVDWGNAHTDKAQQIGGNASRFIQEELTIDNVHDYMFHLLTEYAKQLRYKPAVPRGAVEVTVESMTQGRRGLERKYMMDTVVTGTSSEDPCRL
ncbi:uncharacterized protein LOC133889089, partial [Phragmites australis]|uniref:uncharacterized protein LOC133889089 n=1 Tax=Phragmites australis TaxID=29695 RepID=UPI002D7659E6